MNYEVTGKLHKIMELQVINDKFQKRDIIIETQYPGRPVKDYIKLQLVNAKVTIIDNYQIGDNLRVLFNLRGVERMNNKKGEVEYITNIEAYRIEKAVIEEEPTEEGMKLPFE